jgi:hypothetical protein
LKGDIDLGAGLGKQVVGENAAYRKRENEEQYKRLGLHFAALRTECT